MTTEVTPFERMGGEPFFHDLVAAFYEGDAEDSVLRPLYPEEDLGPAERRLRMFLMQYWGGPKLYQEERGHPRLRLRHAPFRVDDEARRRWLLHMRAAYDRINVEYRLDKVTEAELWDYLERAAQFMMNTE